MTLKTPPAVSSVREPNRRADRFAAAVGFQLKQQPVERGPLRRPEKRRIHPKSKARLPGLSLPFIQDPPVGRRQGAAQAGGVLPLQFGLHFAGEPPRFLLAIGKPVIPQIGSRAKQEVHVAENAVMAEHILILKVTAVAPFVDRDGQLVVSFRQPIGQVEFGGQVAARLYPANPRLT